MSTYQVTEIAENQDLCEEVGYREAGTFEGTCRSCYFAKFTNDGVHCSLHDYFVTGTHRCEEHE